MSKTRKPAAVNTTTNNTVNKEENTMSKNRKNKAAVAAAVKPVEVKPVEVKPVVTAEEAKKQEEAAVKAAMNAKFNSDGLFYSGGLKNIAADNAAINARIAAEKAAEAEAKWAEEEWARIIEARNAYYKKNVPNRADNNTKALLALKKRIKTVYKDFINNSDWRDDFEETVAITEIWEAAFGDILSSGKVSASYNADIDAAAENYMREYISLHDVTEQNETLEAENKALKEELEKLKAENAKLKTAAKAAPKAEAKKTPAPKADVKPAPTAKAKTPAPKADASKKDATVKPAPKATVAPKADVKPATPAPAPAPTAPKLPPMLKKGMSATVVKDYVDRVTASEKKGGLGWIEGRRYIKENYGVTAQKKDVLVVRLVEALNKEVQ